MKPLVAVLCLPLLSITAAEDIAPVVEQALDQAVELSLEKQPLTTAFEIITRETGVQASISEGTLDLLPYGPNTTVSARMQNISLREGLAELTVPLALRFEVGERGIRILPKAALSRILRRATWAELDTLAELHRTDFAADPSAMEGLLGRLQFQFSDIDGWPPLAAGIQRVGAGHGDQVLTLACEALDWTWYPSGTQIVILKKTDQINRQLQRLVSLKESHRKVIDVLSRISVEAGVRVRCEPSALTSLPVNTRNNFSLYVENKSVAEVLEIVAGTTGLGHRIDPDGVVFYHPAESPSPAPTQPNPVQMAVQQPGGPYVGWVALPPRPDGSQVHLLIHEADLTPDVLELRGRYLEAANNAIREALLTLEDQAGQ